MSASLQPASPEDVSDQMWMVARLPNARRSTAGDILESARQRALQPSLKHTNKIGTSLGNGGALITGEVQEQRRNSAGTAQE